MRKIAFSIFIFFNCLTAYAATATTPDSIATNEAYQPLFSQAQAQVDQANQSFDLAQAKQTSDVPAKAATASSGDSSYIDKKYHEAKSDIKYHMQDITSTKTSPLQQQINTERKFENLYGLSFFKPTYVLPAYYTGKPYHSVYQGQTPDGQDVKNMEFKAQLSLKFPVWQNIFDSKFSLDVAYTQLSYWQFYAKSQYFRETNYEPDLFVSYNPVKNWLFYAGVNHQSNGRGGSTERSWNRAYVNIMFSGQHWYVNIEPWMLIFKAESSDLHNPNIRDYLGNGQFVFAYKIGRNTFSILSRNNLQSWFQRGTVQASWMFHVHGHLNLYLQGFTGYGQSLIEYDHYTTGVGIGFALNSWV